LLVTSMKIMHLILQKNKKIQRMMKKRKLPHRSLVLVKQRIKYSTTKLVKEHVFQRKTRLGLEAKLILDLPKITSTKVSK
jgi:hypothetical protein